MIGLFKNKGLMSIDDYNDVITNDKTISLIDVRTKEEYADGHIPGSINLPVDEAENISRYVPDKSAKMLVYCRSGARTSRACQIFKTLGYKNVTNIGGILDWSGKIVKGD